MIGHINHIKTSIEYWKLENIIPTINVFFLLIVQCVLYSCNRHFQISRSRGQAYGSSWSQCQGMSNLMYLLVQGSIAQVTAYSGSEQYDKGVLSFSGHLIGQAVQRRQCVTMSRKKYGFHFELFGCFFINVCFINSYLIKMVWVK